MIRQLREPSDQVRVDLQRRMDAPTHLCRFGPQIVTSWIPPLTARNQDSTMVRFLLLIRLRQFVLPHPPMRCRLRSSNVPSSSPCTRLRNHFCLKHGPFGSATRPSVRSPRPELHHTGRSDSDVTRTSKPFFKVLRPKGV